MPPPELINAIDAVLPVLASAIVEWQQENSPETLKKRVKDMLDANSKTATLKLLGFDCRYDNGWELDHCNGRSGNSTAGDFFKNVQATAIKEWLADIGMPVLTPTEKARLTKSFHYEYLNYMQGEIREMARNAADTHLKELVDALVLPVKVDSHIKAMCLINPTPLPKE